MPGAEFGRAAEHNSALTPRATDQNWTKTYFLIILIAKFKLSLSSSNFTTRGTPQLSGQMVNTFNPFLNWNWNWKLKLKIEKKRTLHKNKKAHFIQDQKYQKYQFLPD